MSPSKATSIHKSNKAGEIKWLPWATRGTTQKNDGPFTYVKDTHQQYHCSATEIDQAHTHEKSRQHDFRVVEAPPNEPPLLLAHIKRPTLVFPLHIVEQIIKIDVIPLISLIRLNATLCPFLLFLPLLPNNFISFNDSLVAFLVEWSIAHPIRMILKW